MGRKDYYNTEREQVLRAAKEKAERSTNLDNAENLSKVNFIYLNRAQMLVYNFASRTTSVEAGRGMGKTSGLISPYLIRTTQSMPRGTGVFLGNSIKQLFTKTVPSAITAIEEMTGLKEGIHFFRGHAPAKCKFKEPITKPKIWENCIHFWNGFVWYMTSTQVKAAANGMNLCAIVGDEARFMPEAIIKGEILPALRGINTTHPGFDEDLNPFYKSFYLVSDAPLTRRQEWLRKRRDEQTTDINEQIVEMLVEANKCPDIIELPKFQKKLNQLRCQSSLFCSFSSLENIDVLGEKYIRDMKRELSDTMFKISILNAEKERIDGGYYRNLNIEEVHGYTNSDEDQINAAYKYYNIKTVTQMYSSGRTFRVESENIDLNELGKNENCLMDTDIIDVEPLRIAFDYGALICCIVCGQTSSKRDTSVLKVLSSMTNTKSSRLEGLCKTWCKYYEPHRLHCRDVIFYYDDTAKQGAAYASEKHDQTRFYNIVKKILKDHKWNVIEIPIGRPMSHSKKYEFINGCLESTQRPSIRINKENNENLIASMENAEVMDGKNGIMKDKSKEKYRIAVDCEDPEAELARRTDLSDAFDTLVIGVRYYGSGRMMGVGMPILG